MKKKKRKAKKKIKRKKKKFSIREHTIDILRRSRKALWNKDKGNNNRKIIRGGNKVK